MDQLGDVNPQSFGLGHVELIERNHDGYAELDDLAGQKEVAFEVRRIDHHQHDIGAPAVGVAAQEDFQRDLLVGRPGGQGIAARKVQYGHTAAVRALEAPFHPLDRDARKVADALTQPGEGIEERGLAGVGIADDGNPQRVVARLAGNGRRIVGRQGALQSTHRVLTRTRRNGRMSGASPVAL